MLPMKALLNYVICRILVKNMSIDLSDIHIRADLSSRKISKLASLAQVF